MLMCECLCVCVRQSHEGCPRPTCVTRSTFTQSRYFAVLLFCFLSTHTLMTSHDVYLQKIDCVVPLSMGSLAHEKRPKGLVH